MEVGQFSVCDQQAPFPLSVIIVKKAREVLLALLNFSTNTIHGLVHVASANFRVRILISGRVLLRRLGLLQDQESWHPDIRNTCRISD